MNRQRYAMIVAYDGTGFAGWQVQPDHRTIQGELERVLQEMAGVPTRVEASGRTDSGVHARGQVAHFDWPGASMRTWSLMRGLNALLPSAIRVRALIETPEDFHARFSAVGKEYRYFIHNETVMMPFHRHYRTLIRDALDVSAMREAAALLEGEHDFAAFAANPNREVEGTVRIVHELSVERDGPELQIKAHGNGFLYKMVRSLAGFLIRVGRGEVDPDMARTILLSRERTARVPTAPPEGLFLWKVHYTSDPFDGESNTSDGA